MIDDHPEWGFLLLIVFFVALAVVLTFTVGPPPEARDDPEVRALERIADALEGMENKQ